MPTYVTTILCMLLTASMMWPSEGAINGNGLPLVLLWLLLGVVTIWFRNQRDRDACVERWSLSAGGSVWVLLVVGFWMSTGAVFQAGGDRRAALNVCLEWTAICVAWWIVRHVIVEKTLRQLILSVVVGLCFGSAVLGIVQYHAIHSQQMQWYQTQRARLDAGSIDAKQVEEEFKAMDIPLSGTGRQLFEQRLLASSEPTGPFALANTLGGLLALSFVMLVGAGLQKSREGESFPWTSVGRILPLVLTIAYCLVLTKSRTAWVSGGLGVVVLLVGRGRFSKMTMRFFLSTVLLLAMVMGVAAGTGALDKEVVLESPRSLQFRLLYWMGAAGVIQEKPIFGAGPGNFRQTYLAHKSVESSEEILDPHNILLDAWCSAGLVGFAGMCLLGWQFFREAFRRGREGDSSETESRSHFATGVGRKVAIPGVVAGAVLHLLERWIGGGPFWDLESPTLVASQNVILLVPLGAVVASVLLVGRLSLSRKVISAAGVTLFVHLLGAGGLQISVVGLVLAVLSANLFSEGGQESTTNSSRSGAIFRIAGTSVLIGCLGVLVVYALIPVQRAENSLAFSKSLESRGNGSASLASLQIGIDSDPFSVTLRQRRAEMLTYQLTRLADVRAQGENTDGPTVGRLSESVLLAADALIAADRRNWSGYLVRSNARRAVAQAGVGGNYRERALDDLVTATELYPTNVELWVMLAQLSDLVGQPDRTWDAVERALAIEESNQNWGHADRFLSEQKLKWLNAKKRR